MKLQPKNSKMVMAVMASLLFCAANTWAQSGTWTNNPSGTASGSWAASVNWLNGVIATGAGNTADFSTLDITNGSTVTLDGAQTIGNLIIADQVPSTNWTFNAGTPSTSALTMAASSGSPVINVNNQLATFGASVFGTSGFIKAGAGTLRLNAANTNAAGTLSGLIYVTNGILQAGNNGCFGVNGAVVNGSSTNAVICTNGGTVEIISTIQPNNELLLLAGNGNGGTNGALYCNQPANAGSTRWGLSSVNSAGVSGNSSVSAPAILMVADAAIRIDGAAVGAFSNLLNCGYISSSTNATVNPTNAFFTLTKTGTGRLNFERGVLISNILVQAGSVLPDSANSFNGVNQWTVRSGAGLYVNQNQVFNAATISVQLDAGSVMDMNWRGTGVVGSDTTTYSHNLGTLTGAGTVTSGTMGNTGVQTLNINGTNNCSFSGPIITTHGVLNLGKTGAGSILRLSGANSYNGITTVSAGTLLVDGSHTGGSNYVVSAGATLGGSGTIIPGAPNVISLSGTLAAGDNGGMLTVSNVTGAGSLIVSNASLFVLGTIGASGSPLTSAYFNNCTNTINLQGGSTAAIYAATVNVDGANNTLNVLIANPAVGQFPLIGNVTTIGGLNGFSGLNLQLANGVYGYLSNNVANASIDLVITGTSTLVWSGNPNGNWDIGSTANWLNGGTPATYTETAGIGPFVNFDDTATGTATVNLTTTVTPKGLTVNSSSKNYTLSGSGIINGSGNWLKSGSSTLTLANSSANTMNGSITISAGAVSVGNGGTVGNLGSASVLNSGSLIFNRSDNVTVGNPIGGSGSLVNQGTGSTTLTSVGSISGAVTINAGTLALAPASAIIVSGNVTGGGIFGVTGAGKVTLTSPTITYSGGTVINTGTLELDNAFPPTGNISDNGTLALGFSGTLANNISGTGGVSLINSSAVTLGGVNTYAGPTVVLGGSVTATASGYSPNSVLDLGDQSGATQLSGLASFTAGNPVVAGLNVGGNSFTAQGINFGGNGQTFTINGNVSVGALLPSEAAVLLQPTGAGVSLVVNTNGGTIQVGLGAPASALNPDSVYVDLSGIDNFIANLGTNGTINLGTVDGNPGPPTGATVVNYFNLAAVSNSITAGLINIGAGGRQLVPELRLGAGTNVINVNTLGLGLGQSTGGRDGGYLHFLSGTGGLQLRAADGVSRAAFSVGSNPTTTTGASITNTVDFTGHPVDLFVSALIIGNYNNVGVYQNTFSFDTGTLDAQSTSLSVLRNNNANAAASGSTLNINGGTASLGAVSLTASAAYGTLNIANANVTVAGVTAPGTGVSTLSIANSTLTLALTNSGNPVTAPIVAGSLTLGSSVNLNVSGPGLAVGQFPLMSYSGAIGGTGFSALTLASLPASVTGYLSNNIANASVDLVITSAPATINPNPTNILASVSANQLTLQWDVGHIGWLLQSNGVALANSGAWVTIPGSGATNKFTFPVDATQKNVFFRMLKP